MKQKIIVPKKVEESINSFKRKDKRAVALKVYAALLTQETRKSKTGYFDVPSKLLVSINKRYNSIIDKFLEDGIIKFFSRPTIVDNVFEPVEKKYYSVGLGICMKYKFLIDITEGVEYEVEAKPTTKRRWYDVIKTSLVELGYEPKITRDNFGFRIHHSAIYNYKENLANKGLSVIDGQCSQPKLLYLYMKERGYNDKNYSKIFEEGKDFYSVLQQELQLSSREEAKKLFNLWIGSKGFIPDRKLWTLFPLVNNFLNNIKLINYKDAIATLQRYEAKIWIEDILENLPINFALPIHDALLVKSENVIEVLEYCKTKYPRIDFDVKQL